MTVQNPPYVILSGSHSAELFRRAYGVLIPNPGVIDAGDLAVTANPTPAMNVEVAAGTAVLEGTNSSAQGYYYAFNDATVQLTIAAANSTNPRTDIIVAEVQDAQYSGATNAWSLAVVTGTPSGSPVTPTAPANSIVLAHVHVGASVTTIVAGNITDVRPFAIVGASLPYGYVASSLAGSQASVSASESDSTASVTLVTDGTRRFKVTATVISLSASTTLIATAKITNGSNTLLSGAQTNMGIATGTQANGTMVGIDTPAAGTVTYKVRGVTTTGTCQFLDINLVVEDVGPA